MIDRIDLRILNESHCVDVEKKLATQHTIQWNDVTGQSGEKKHTTSSNAKNRNGIS